jgi:hypothetical protein
MGLNKNRENNPMQSKIPNWGAVSQGGRSG